MYLFIVCWELLVFTVYGPGGFQRMLSVEWMIAKYHLGYDFTFNYVT